MKRFIRVYGSGSGSVRHFALRLLQFTYVAGCGKPFSKNVTLLTKGLESTNLQSIVTFVPWKAVVFPES